MTPADLERSQRFAAATFAAFDAAYAAAVDEQQADEQLADEQQWSLAGRALRVRSVAPDLVARFRPTLEHVVHAPVADQRIDLDIGCWDRALTTVDVPPPPWGLDDYLPEARIRGHVDGRIRATFDTGARVLCLYDRDRGRAVLHAASAALVPEWMDRAPYRTILTWWASDRGLAVVHASAVAWGDGAALVAGGSGAGKSTTAMACLAAGLDLLGDDACLVGLEPAPHLWSVYRRAKLEPDAARWLPALDALAVARVDEQTLIDPGDRHRRDAPLRAVLFPRVSGERATRVTPMPRAEAMRVLTATTLAEGGGMARAALPTLAAIARDVRCVRLELGHDLAGVAEAVRTVIEETIVRERP